MILQAAYGAAASSVSASDLTTHYRVYQNDQAVKEFSTEAGAVAFAKNLTYSHVELITGRVWVWDNFPKYKVYENGYSTGNREFRTLAEAKTFAGKLRFPQIRDLEQPGWISGTYPRFQMYQGDKSLPGWSYASLDKAKQAAKAYSNIHIVELATNQWIWDNLSAAQKQAQRSAAAVYDIRQNGASTGSMRYSFLLDAMRAAARQPGSVVVNTATGLVPYTTIKPFTVTQNGRPVQSFSGLGGALVYAKTLSGAAIEKDGQEWWTNIPYLSVRQGERVVSYFHTRQGAVAFAKGYKNASVAAADGRIIWSDTRELAYLAWNGTSSTDTILAQVQNTQGLDIDSPSWFELAGSDGTLTDHSDPALAASMEKEGLKLTPLVHNQFDTKMTSVFLRNPAAKAKFINSLVERLAALKVEGVNLDFEGLDGGDRALYTSFVASLAEAAHQRGLTVSIDLPRGDVAWDAQTAYDHKALANIADMIMIMAYDQYWEGSQQAGSVSELRWAEEGIKQFLAYGIPRGKLMLGIPFYVREWRLDSAGKLVDSKAVFMKDVAETIQQQDAVGTYDPGAGQTKYTYKKDGYTYVFWAETADTVKARVDLARKYGLAGVAAWRLGYESSSLWTMLLQQK
ncbi:glycoside hydrolase [Paenibacillus sepulcri]|uniref:Glycoside hydrolase n=2 Tax=Paenibacillus sepulcri TaxID=359917 RepID=A0ABS7C0J9_9BACL|nr:glycoside hydrolase [Paenibacillus sepulcri]